MEGRRGQRREVGGQLGVRPLQAAPLGEGRSPGLQPPCLGMGHPGWALPTPLPGSSTGFTRSWTTSWVAVRSTSR